MKWTKGRFEYECGYDFNHEYDYAHKYEYKSIGPEVILYRWTQGCSIQMDPRSFWIDGHKVVLYMSWTCGRFVYGYNVLDPRLCFFVMIDKSDMNEISSSNV